MANVKDNKPLSDDKWAEMKRLIDKGDKITERQAIILKECVLRETNYNPKVLTVGIKADLIKMYAKEVYGKGSIGVSAYENMATEKGTIQETESIKLLSEIDGIKYTKNNKRYSNRYIMGIPDVIVTNGERKVIEIKSSLDINTFLSKHESGLQFEYLCQMKGYLELLKADFGEVCYCLVNMPPEIINQEVRKVKAKYFLYGKSEEDLERRIKFIYDSMIFDDIPIERRVIRFRVDRDTKFMQTVYERVKIARDWLKEFHKNHVK